MNNLRLLTGLLSIALLSGGVCAYGQSVITLEEIFESADTNSSQLRPYFTAQTEAEREISVARAGRLPDINASLSLSYIGDGFTTKRNFSDYQKAPIPHLGTGLSLNITQPVYTGGEVTNAIELAELKSTAARFATDLQRDNIRFQLTGFYLDIYKYHNLRTVVASNIASAQKVLEEMRARYEQGTALLNDITRYELLVSNLQLQLVRINNTIDILNTNLVTTAGLPEGTLIIPDSTILARSLPKEGAAWWQTEAEANSPSLSLARSGVDISRKAELLVRGERLHHPYISFRALKNCNVIRATCIYLVFFTLIATEHVFEHSYAENILGFDETNLIDLNWYVFAGIVDGCAFTYLTFALHKWRYKTMTAIAFALAIVYLGYFYFFIDYGVEKEMLFIPLFFRGASAVIISIVFLTSIVQSGLPFQVFPQALTINGFTGAVMGATLGPAVIGEILRQTMAKNASLLGANIMDTNPDIAFAPLGQLYGMVQTQALVVSMKEIYGWLLIIALASLTVILLSYSSVRPFAIFPKWSTVRRVVRHLVRTGNG